MSTLKIDPYHQQSIGRTLNHTGLPRKTRIVTDPEEIRRICMSQPKATAERMRESILKQNGVKP